MKLLDVAPGGSNRPLFSFLFFFFCQLEGKNGGQELRILVLEEEKVFEWTFQVK